MRYCGSCNQPDTQFVDAVDVTVDHIRGWSNALFPAKAPKPDSTSGGGQNADRAQRNSRPIGPAAAGPAKNEAPIETLFVLRSCE